MTCTSLAWLGNVLLYLLELFQTLNQCSVGIALIALQTWMWCTCAADHECVELSSTSVGPTTTQTRLTFAPVEAPVERKPGKPVKRRAKRGDASHQEWCAAAYDVVKTTTDKDGRPTSIVVECLLCKRRNIHKEYTVLSEGKKDRKCQPSASWSGPKRHMKDVHNLHTADARVVC